MKTIVKKMHKTNIKQEVALLRSAVIGLIGRDTEGEYRPKFVESVFRALAEKPTMHFTTPEKFLADIERA